MNAARLDPTRAIVVLLLGAILAVAFVTRLHLLVIRGGLSADQVAWAYQHYYGGLTKGYLFIRDTILSRNTEPFLAPYLPGYPAFLATLYALGVKDLFTVRFIQIVADTLAVLPLCFVLHRIGKSTYLALAVGLIYALAPWWSAGSTYLVGESLLPALMILLLVAMLLIRDRAESSVNWFLLGLFSAVLPFFRSDMLLLFGPLAIWALLVAPPRRRFISAAWVIAGFVIPFLLWAGRNYYVHHQFALTPPAKWYAAWSGLGQIPNDFGYFVDDERAGKLLRSKGIRWNSLESESYWFRQYVEAWVGHPTHVLRTILHRFWLILGRPDTTSSYPSRLVLFAYQAMAFVTPIALVWLLRARRWADAFLIALPMLYALGSLGLLYVEPRYIRYAGLTYLLVLPIVLGQGKDWLVGVWTRRWQLGRIPYLEPVLATISLAAIVVLTFFQLAQLTRDAQRNGMAARLEVDQSQPATSALADIDFRAVPNAEFWRDGGRLHLQANAPSGRYLLMAPVGAQVSGAATIRYVTSLRGSIGLGVLTADGSRWLSHTVVNGSSTGEVEGTFSSGVEPGSQFVITAEGTGVVNMVATKVEWLLVCPTPPSLFNLLFDRTAIPARECSARRQSS